MTQCGNNFLCLQHCIAYAAVLSFGFTGLGAGRCNRGVRYHGVLRGGDNFLCLQHGIAYAAVAAFGQAGLGAGGGNCFIYYLGVTSGRIIRILYFFFTIEVLSAQQNCDRIYIFSDLRTGCIDLTLDRNAICCSGDHFLTVLALRRNICCSKATVRRNMPIPYGFSSFSHSMTNSRDDFLFRQLFLTYAAVAACRQAVLGAGGCNGCIRYLLVTRGGIDFLCLQHFITYAAMRSFGFAVLGAGGCNCCVRYHGVTRCWDALPLLHDLTTGLALLFRCITIFCTGIWHICLCLYNVIMFCFLRDHLLLFDYCRAVQTHLSICQTGLCTGSRLSPDCFGSVISDRIIRIIYFFFTIELLSAQQNCDRIYIFSDLRTGCIDLTLDRNAICCSGDHFLTVLALRRNICCSKATVRRNMPIPYGFSSFSHSMTNSRDARPFRQHFITYATVATPPPTNRPRCRWVQLLHLLPRCDPVRE